MSRLYQSLTEENIYFSLLQIKGGKLHYWNLSYPPIEHEFNKLVLMGLMEIEKFTTNPFYNTSTKQADLSYSYGFKLTEQGLNIIEKFNKKKEEKRQQDQDIIDLAKISNKKSSWALLISGIAVIASILIAVLT